MIPPGFNEPERIDPVPHIWSVGIKILSGRKPQRVLADKGADAWIKVAVSIVVQSQLVIGVLALQSYSFSSPAFGRYVKFRGATRLQFPTFIDIWRDS